MRYKYTVHYTEHKNAKFATNLNFALNWVATVLCLPGGIAIVAAIYILFDQIINSSGTWPEALLIIACCIGIAAAVFGLRVLVLFVAEKLTAKVAAVEIAERTRAETPLEPEGRPCSMCGQMIDKQANVCPHCGYERPKL